MRVFRRLSEMGLIIILMNLKVMYLLMKFRRFMIVFIFYFKWFILFFSRILGRGEIRENLRIVRRIFERMWF